MQTPTTYVVTRLDRASDGTLYPRIVYAGQDDAKSWELYLEGKDWVASAEGITGEQYVTRSVHDQDGAFLGADSYDGFDAGR